MAESDDASALPAHKLEWGIDLTWRNIRPHAAYIEVESPIDQNRIMGEGPGPWRTTPRYAFSISMHPTSVLHVAGWEAERDEDGEHIGWRITDIYLPFMRVEELEIIHHDDWEGKVSDSD